MRHSALNLSLALAAVLVSGPAAHAGTVQVSYVQPEQFADAGRGVEAERVQTQLTRHFETLAKRWLPESQSLQVEVLDIDLAGETWPRVQAPMDVRVLKGRADWPQMTLRFTLRDGERTLASGQDRLTDMAYLMHGGALFADRGELPYEARMLEDWFRERLVLADGSGNKAAYKAR